MLVNALENKAARLLCDTLLESINTLIILVAEWDTTEMPVREPEVEEIDLNEDPIFEMATAADRGEVKWGFQLFGDQQNAYMNQINASALPGMDDTAKIVAFLRAEAKASGLCLVMLVPEQYLGICVYGRYPQMTFCVCTGIRFWCS